MAFWLARNGWRIVGFYDILEKSSAEAARITPCGVFDSMEKLVDRCEILFITVPDDAIISVCEHLGELRDFSAKFLFHTSGILPSKILRLAGLDKAVYCIHPFGGVSSISKTENPFKSLFFGCEGDLAASDIAENLVTSLEGKFIHIDCNTKGRYHFGASLAANHSFALLEICSKLLEDSGIQKKNAIDMTISIVEKAIENFRKFGFANGATGPVVRNDELTIAQHLIAANQTGNLDIYIAGLEKIRELLRKGN